jgi:hypothetical protein
VHEDDQSVIGVLIHLTFKSPTIMCELRKIFLLVETYDIKNRTLYIRSAANIWANNLSPLPRHEHLESAARPASFTPPKKALGTAHG